MSSNRNRCVLCNLASPFLDENKVCRCITPSSSLTKVRRIRKNKSVLIEKIKSQDLIALHCKYKSLCSEKIVSLATNYNIRLFDAITYDRDYSKADKEAFLKSPLWVRLRFLTLAKYKKCCLCGSSENLHCDHIKPMATHWHLRDDSDNLQILCRDCNIGKSALEGDYDFR